MKFCSLNIIPFPKKASNVKDKDKNKHCKKSKREETKIMQGAEENF